VLRRVAKTGDGELVMWNWIGQHPLIREAAGDIFLVVVIVLAAVTLVVLFAIGWIQDAVWRYRAKKDSQHDRGDLNR
jgi:heme/copper-type cytochrome/quinol oxidase subunit 2